jgi:hypothetical protein
VRSICGETFADSHAAALRGDERREEMKGCCTKSFRAVVAIGAVAVLFATVSVAAATPTSASGCAQLKALKKVFPKATAVGFTTRTAVTRGGNPPRSMEIFVWPGICGGWETEYRQLDHSVWIGLGLYRTHKQAMAAFTEATSGPTFLLADGAHVRYIDGTADVNGVQERDVGVETVYRNVFVSSLETAEDPFPLAGQLRLHRRIHAGVRAMAR